MRLELDGMLPASQARLSGRPAQDESASTQLLEGRSGWPDRRNRAAHGRLGGHPTPMPRETQRGESAASFWRPTVFRTRDGARHQIEALQSIKDRDFETINKRDHAQGSINLEP